MPAHLVFAENASDDDLPHLTDDSSSGSVGGTFLLSDDKDSEISVSDANVNPPPQPHSSQPAPIARLLVAPTSVGSWDEGG